MPTGRVIGDYWQDFNRQVDAGQVHPLVSGIANFTPGPALGNFYSNVQEGNVPGASTSALAALPIMPILNSLKGARLGPASPMQLQRLVGASGAVPVALNRAKTSMSYLTQQGWDKASELLSEYPLDISFGSGKGN